MSVLPGAAKRLVIRMAASEQFESGHHFAFLRVQWRIPALSAPLSCRVTALGRELLGFIWAIGIKTETAARQRIAA
jgi:hypothetical protein